MIDNMSWLFPLVLSLNVLACAAWLMPRGWRVVLRTSRASAPAPAPSVVAGAQAEAQAAPDGLEAWIDDVERDEAQAGGDAFWREWASSGGNLPRAADSGRVAS